MKTKTALLLLSLGLCLFACKKPQEVVDDKPAIKSISFEGIPAQNVRLDARTSIITVQLPAVLPEVGLKPVLELVNGASVVRGLLPDGTISVSSYCACNYPSGAGTYKDTLAIVVGNAAKTTYYRLRIIPPTGPMKAIATDTQFVFSRQTKLLRLSLPVENLYTNPQVRQIDFINVATGLRSVVNADASCLSGCSDEAPNQLLINLTSPIELRLTPGTYKVTAGGVEFPQKLVVTE
ncbi:hypothetical protein [Persicitalea jodogahamensis]|uniref:Uncharacterized protein n=1 Tax=Persicitalea jodogahamensis TaxID=402147 RepID=A0A8J3D1Y4_9BACT|nr:hypothetical protein [Persicitalea jodogahamensis]GHB52387.1 hypothetical protein GCM10007390_01280 [Persicitalea jodogahamensis]